jgi:hypothetical protein
MIFDTCQILHQPRFGNTNRILWDYFGFLDKKVPKCYLSGADF